MAVWCTQIQDPNLSPMGEGSGSSGSLSPRSEKSSRYLHGSAAQRAAKAPRFRGNPFLRAVARQKFFPPNIPLGTKFGAEPCTRPCGLAHSQHQISLSVSRPYAHVVRSGLFYGGKRITGVAAFDTRSRPRGWSGTRLRSQSRTLHSSGPACLYRSGRRPCGPGRGPGR